MKKKLISLVLAFLMTVIVPLGCIAETGIAKLNEDFSIRNGIRFGMTKSTVYKGLHRVTV